MKQLKFIFVFIAGIVLGLAVMYAWNTAFKPSKYSFVTVLDKLENGDIKNGDLIREVADILGKETVLDNHYDRSNDKEYIIAIYIRDHEFLEFYYFDGKVFAARWCAGIFTNTNRWYIFDREMYSQYVAMWVRVE